MLNVNEFLKEFLKPNEYYTLYFHHYLKDKWEDENTRAAGLKIGTKVEGIFKREMLEKIAKKYNVSLEEWNISKRGSDPPLNCYFFCLPLSEEEAEAKAEKSIEEKAKELMKNLIECMRECRELDCRE